MKSFLFCTSYVDSNSEEYSSLRYKKWINYYLPLMDELNVGNIFLINDGSADLEHLTSMSVSCIAVDSGLPEELPNGINVFYFTERLGRLSPTDYPGWWRSFTFASQIAAIYGFDKVIHVESDFFITGKKLVDYIANLEKGWVSLYSDCYEFAETAIQIICKDQLPRFAESEKIVRTLNYILINNMIAERILPITEVKKGFKGDRFGEFKVLKHWSKSVESLAQLDYFGQLPSKVRILSPDELQRLILSLNNIELANQEGLLTAVTEFVSNNNLMLNPVTDTRAFLAILKEVK